jgi:eukaryotic-like serine/threonine-protein kinase
VTNRIGEQLGNYQLIQLLGEGSFAEVYLGGHIHLGTLAAIKVLRTQLDDDGFTSFRLEARLIAHLMHPHIVRILEFGIEDNTPFLVMDFAPHGTLRQRHPKGTPLPLSTVISYTKQVADALQCAHEERLIHRDVKPENMLLGRRDEVLLSDFGTATLAQRASRQHSSDTSGTMLYMAPEQIRGRPCLASDQYSLGVVVYEWLGGRCPFHGASALEVAMKHLSAPPQPLRELVPSLSPALEDVVLRALAKDPQERFTSVQDFAAALERASLLDESSIRPFPVLQTEQPLPLWTAASPLDGSFSTLPSSPSDNQLPALEKELGDEDLESIT